MNKLRTVWPAAVLIFALVGSPGSALATAAAESPVKIVATAGYDQRYVPTKGVPLSIVLESTRAVAGDLNVTSVAPDGSTLVRSIPMEIPSGGKKQFDLVIPGASATSSRLQITVRDSERALTSARLDLIPAGDQLLVGTFTPDSLASLAGARIEPTGQEVHPAFVPEAWLGLGVKALQPLSYLVIDSDLGSTLSEEDRQTIVDWVVTGGRLVVTTRDPMGLDWLPKPWQTEWSREGSGWVPAAGPAGTVVAGRAYAAQAGLGRAVVAPNAGPSDVGPLIQALTPAPSSTANRSEFMGPGAEFDLLSALSSRAGGSVRLSWLVGFLVLYVAIAGPINYFILKKRGRKELAWITIPLLAVIFSTFAYGLARSARGGLAIQQASVVFATPEGQADQRIVTVSSGTGGQHRVQFAGRDASQPWGASGMAFAGNGSPNRSQVVRLTGAGSEAILETSPFSSGVATGSVGTNPGFLEGLLTWNGTALTGKVTNRTTIPLNVTVLTPGGREEAVGKLDAGASKEVEIEGSDPVAPPIRFDPFMVRGGQGSDEQLRRALTTSLHTLLGPEHTFGAPLLVGYTSSYAPELTVDNSKKSPAGPAIVVSPVQVSVPAATTGRIPSSAGQMEIVSVDGFAYYSGYALQLQDFREAVFSYRLPPGVGSSKVKDAIVTKGFGGLGFRLESFDWGLKRWVATTEADGFNRQTVPAAAFSQNGEAYLRITPENEPYLELWGLNMGVNLQ